MIEIDLAIASQDYANALKLMTKRSDAKPYDVERLMTLVHMQLQMNLITPARHAINRLENLIPGDPRLSELKKSLMEKSPE